MLSQSTTSTTSSSGAFAALGMFMFFYLVILVFMIIAWVKIVTKAGYSGVWVLVGLVPILNVVMFFVFAFSRWPALDRGVGSPYGNSPTLYTDRSQAYVPPRNSGGLPPTTPPGGFAPPPPAGFGPPPGPAR